MTETMHRCPRRDEGWLPPPAASAPQDTWRPREAGLACSYCGSLHPDAFMAAVESGAELVPTDKNYKAYVRLPERGETKFYYQHLSAEQQQRLIELANARKIVFDFPGYWYVLPFFARRRPVEGAPA